MAGRVFYPYGLWYSPSPGGFVTFSLAKLWQAVRSGLAEAWGAFSDPSPISSTDRSRLLALEEELEAIRAEWRIAQRALHVELEQMQDLSNVVETKRKRVAAAESKRKQREGGDGADPFSGVDPNSEEALRARAIERGLW